jgi:hypothetical protein
MANKTRFVLQDTFYGGQVRDDKSRAVGSNSNVEELEIFENSDFIRPAQVFSSDSMPSNTSVYDYDADSDDTMYAYAEDTSSSNVRLLSVSSGGSDNPGSFSTLFTSSSGDAPISYGTVKWFETSENTDGFLYYIAGNNLKRYNLNTSSEETTDSSGTTMSLSGLNDSFDRPTMKVIFGDLYICHGQFIAKVDSDGVFTEKAFTMPTEWEAIDLEPVSDIALILARNTVRNTNHCKGFWWDLVRTSQFDDSFNIPMGGPQWLTNFKENLIMFCSINGRGKYFQLSSPNPGAKPLALNGIELDNMASETSNQPISPTKSVQTKGDTLYYALNKTDKTGIYALGQIDSNKSAAVLLSKRYATSDYSNHTPYTLHIQGPNFYGAYDDNGTDTSVRCESNNSPDRSSNAVLETVIIDDGDPAKDKDLQAGVIMTKDLPASTSIATSIRTDYSTGSYTALQKSNGNDHDTGVLAYLTNSSVDMAGIKTMQLKLEFTSNGTDTPQLVGLGFLFGKSDGIAKN